jgi:hypothetical protein
MTKQKRNDGFYDKNNKNYEVLVVADKYGWKVATKTKGMIARMLETDAVVHSIEGPLNAKAGQFVCRGVNTNDWWVQKGENIAKKYDDEGIFKESVEFNKQKYKDFKLYMPKPDRVVLVCQIPGEFTVHASWGTLKGKKGDFLIKPFEDELNSNPQDVWLVDLTLFKATYEIK